MNSWWRRMLKAGMMEGMAFGKSVPEAPRGPRPKWWQVNQVSTNPDITDICHYCGHVRDVHKGKKCKAPSSWTDPDARSCDCPFPNHWVVAELHGLTL